MPKAEPITSAANPLWKDVRRAIVRGSLTEEGCSVAESFHLLEEALRSGCEVKAVLAAESARPAAETLLRGHPAIRLVALPDALFQRLAATETSQGVIALVRPPAWTMEQLFRGSPLVVVLDGVQDPGNAGAIVRAAEAFGATGALFVKGSASPHNPKTLRASAGSLFRLPCLHGVDAAAAREALERNKLALYAGVPTRSSRSIAAVDLTARCALIVGNEAHGVSRELRAAAIEVFIPTVGVESLNAAMAAGIMLYEARRQRSAHP
jgi:TrmH family RNA methyltransferase